MQGPCDVGLLCTYCLHFVYFFWQIQICIFISVLNMISMNKFQIFSNLSVAARKRKEEKNCPQSYPILDTRISGLRPSVCHAQGTPPGF